MIGIPNGLDVPSLDDFPRDKPLVNAFESQFLISMHPQQLEDMSSKLLFRVRKMLSSVGQHIDGAIEKNSTLPRLYLQDHAQSEVLNMDIVAIKMSVGDYSPGVKWRLPVIVVAWSRIRSGDMEAFTKLRKEPPWQKFKHIPMK